MGGSRFWAVPRRLTRTLARLRPLTRRALIAKLSPDVTAIGDLARACEQGGADAVTAVNTFVGMAIDLDRLRHRLNRTNGGLSGPADWGYLSGSGLLSATNMGRLAGIAAAKLVTKSL